MNSCEFLQSKAKPSFIVMSLTRILLLALCVVYTGACTCLRKNYPKDYCQADLVIRGKVTSEKEDKKNDEYVYTVQFDIVIKMPLGFTGVNPIEIRTSKWDSMCGTRLPINVSFLLLAYENNNDDGGFGIGACDGNIEWRYLNADVKQLLTNNFVSRVCA